VTGSYCSSISVASGWTLYPPLSTRDSSSLNSSIDLVLLSVHLLGASSLAGGINMLATGIGMSLVASDVFNRSLYFSSLMITSMLLVIALPVLAVGITCLLMDRNLSVCLLDASLGGDPIMYQHLFWFFGHPEVYVIIVPVFGIICVSVVSSCRVPVFGYDSMLGCMLSIGTIGFVV
jgi:cytochrome c oxidase subunit 1